MALFLVGYLITVTSTIAFIVAILTPKWIYPNTSSVNATYPSSPNETNYRGIFYVDTFYPRSCRDWILLYKDSLVDCRPPYAIACASLSIIASSLSIILLWLIGCYLYVRRKRLVPRFVAGIAVLTLLIFWITAVVWIVMITMNRDEYGKMRRENIGYSTWIAVGSTGGFLLAFVAFMIYWGHLKRRRYPQVLDGNSRRF